MAGITGLTLHKRIRQIIAILCKNGVLLGKAWHSSKVIFLKMSPNNVTEGGESENRAPRARARVVYAVVNIVLKNSKNR